MSRCCSQCGSNGHNSRTCSSPADDDSSVVAGDGSGVEIMLFGVRVKVDPMRKSVSMNNLSQYEQPNESSNAYVSAAAAVAADTGYASADDAVRNQSNVTRERKRGTPWTEDEHKLFLIGLQKVGKGDWRGISRNFVKTRTPTQVASHAQKYFLRRSNLNRRRRRSSLFDITTDTVTAIPMEEEQVHQDNNTSRSVLPPPLLPLQEISPLSGFPMAPFPATVGPVLIPVQIENPLGKLTLGNVNQVNTGSMMPVCPIASLPMPNASADINLSQKSAIDPSPLSLKLSLSLSSDQYQTRHSAFQVMSSFNNGDNFISVA